MVQGTPSVRLLVGLSVLGSLVTVVGCQVLAGFADVTFTQAGSGGSDATGGSNPGGAGAGGGGPGGANACDSFTPPLRPAADPGGNDEEIVLALRALNFGEEMLTDGPLTGYDLDERCTCHGDESSCEVSDAVTIDGECDGPRGQDNNMARVIKLLSATSDISSAQITQDLEDGGWSLIFRIRDYNGLPNDDQVEVFVLNPRSVQIDPCYPGPGPDGPTRWDGTDLWPILDSSLTPGGNGGGGMGGAGGAGMCPPDSDDPRLEDAKFVDVNAYVADGVLVTNLPTVELFVFGNTVQFPMRITAGFITGRLSHDGSLWQLTDGQLAGRVAEENVFGLLSGMRLDDQPLCTNDGGYDVLAGLLCAHMDIHEGAAGPTTPCNALSMGASIRATQAAIGSIVGPAIPTPGCTPETDPTTDSCSDGPAQ